MSHLAKSKMLEKACKNLGIDISSVKCFGPDSKHGEHCRVYLSSDTSYDKTQMAADIISSAYGLSIISSRNVGKTHSGMHETMQVVDSTGVVHNVIFSGGLTSGARGGGYEYENDIKNAFKTVNVNAEEGTVDVTKTDVFVKTAKGKPINIEVKAKGAKFGQPTLQYSYETKEFNATRAKSPEGAQPLIDVLNDMKKNPELRMWLDSLKQAWDTVHPHNKMKVFDKQVQVKDWDSMMDMLSIKQSGPKIHVDPASIVRYYKKKGAHYIQLKGKGLFAFDDILQLGVPIFETSVGEANIKPEILTSGGNKVIRASLEVTNLKPSNWDLDSHESLIRFANALAKN